MQKPQDFSALNTTLPIAQNAVLVLLFVPCKEFNSRLKGNVMSETQVGSSISNIAGAVVIAIILSLTGIIVFQQSQLSKAVTALATVSAKCSK